MPGLNRCFEQKAKAGECHSTQKYRLYFKNLNKKNLILIDKSVFAELIGWIDPKAIFLSI
jgi:hypothetical protein